MTRALALLAFAAMVLVAGCVSPERPPTVEWGEPYADVVIPAGFDRHDNPPFRREDGSGGARIFGRYSYRAKELVQVENVASFMKEELPKQGWTFVDEQIEADQGTYQGRFEKDDDKLDIDVRPDRAASGAVRYSILTVTMNGQFDN